MYLLIDSSEDNQISYCIFNEDKLDWRTDSGKAKDFLRVLDEFLSDLGLKKEEIKGIGVVTGEGRFTSTRIAAVIANMFGYVFDLPLLAVSKNHSKQPQQLISKIKEQPKGRYVSAKYSGQPNIN